MHGAAYDAIISFIILASPWVFILMVALSFYSVSVVHARKISISLVLAPAVVISLFFCTASPRGFEIGYAILAVPYFACLIFGVGMILVLFYHQRTLKAIIASIPYAIVVVLFIAVHLIPLLKAQVTVKAVDDDGKPLADIMAEVGLASGGTIKKGLTDTNGIIVFKGNGSEGCFFYSLKKEKFYISEGKLQLSEVQGKWQPWNPVITQVVRRIINPIPMYAKRVRTHIPRTNEWFGYDLTIGDWISPVGAGIVSDIVF